MIFTLYILVAVTGNIVYASFFEWVLHRYVMHRPIGKFRYPYEAHARTHHRIFGYKTDYHLQHDHDKQTIRMAIWNAPVLIALALLPIFPIAIWLDAWWLLIITTVVFLGYYAVYEYSHWCMHLPKRRRIEKGRCFRIINGLHLLHHRYPKKNFNVVLPIADIVFRTFMLRSPTPFMQPRGLGIPDVQPRRE